jgi:tetratricopeptide (TPR) repeat protein
MTNKSISFGSGDLNIVQGDGNIICYHSEYPLKPCQLAPVEPFFIGREEEIAWLLEQLHPGKIVAICGPGGIGKSALAAQVVHILYARRFPDGIIFHSFYHQPQTVHALQHIAQSLNIAPEPTLETAVRIALAGRKMLLIFDGTEEAEDLQAILNLRGSCGVLITSRKKSDGLSTRLDLSPLTGGEATQLLQGLVKQNINTETAQNICTLLANWPLAIRIAGRYLADTGENAEEYLRLLAKEPLKELGSSGHHEENIALLMRRSVAQLTEDDRLSLALAGTLAFAPIAREPVASIFDGDERRAHNALNELVNYGLLEKRAERWQIGHALIHTFAHTELSLSKDMLARLAAYYITFCDTQNKAGLPGYVRLDAERAHCLRLLESCLNSGLWQEVKALEEVLWEYLDRQGWWKERLIALEMRLIAARQSGNRRDEGLCLNNLGYTCWQSGEYDKVLAWYEQSLPIWRELGDRQGEGRTLNNIAEIYRQQGKYELALEQYQHSLSIAREIGDRKGEGTILNNIGLLYNFQGDYKTALLYYEQSLPIARENNNKIMEGSTLNNIGLLYCVQGKPAKGMECYHQALAIAQQLGDKGGEALTRWNIGLTYEELGDVAKAEKHITQAVQIYEKIGHPDLERCREGLARVRAKRQAASCG